MSADSNGGRVLLPLAQLLATVADPDTPEERDDAWDAGPELDAAIRARDAMVKSIQPTERALAVAMEALEAIAAGDYEGGQLWEHKLAAAAVARVRAGI